MTPASVPHAYEPMQTWDQRRSSEQRPPVPPSLPAATTNLLPTLPVTERSREPPFHLKALPSRANPNGLSEEMTIYTETRMLQDQTGRLRKLPSVLHVVSCHHVIQSDLQVRQYISAIRRPCRFSN